MTVAVTLTHAAKKDIDSLPAVAQARVAARIAALSAYPLVSGVKALKGKLKGQFRIRVGDYRIVFTVATNSLTIVAIDDRKDAY